MGAAQAHQKGLEGHQRLQVLERDFAIFDIEQMKLLEDRLGVEPRPPDVDELTRGSPGECRPRPEAAFGRVVTGGDQQLLDAGGIGPEQLAQHLAIDWNPGAGDVDEGPILIEQDCFDRHARLVQRVRSAVGSGRGRSSSGMVEVPK